ncbi:neuraminidase-like domain-containing protein [Sporocytophaga myxococcoides]|uniref:neuraminidase-like domain-containing protein n=1 Tax=Sporocytophaga myxococcoides TaxID=153721 RepID=UPI000426EA30|nr:neuraminidase-like domain-containing protein [Sporocytophaga myxococcoides]
MGNIEISGFVLTEKTARPVANLRIEAWDKDYIIDDLLGSATSDDKGFFSIQFNEKYYSELLFDRRPDIYFKVFKGDYLLVDTSNNVRWNAERKSSNIIISIPLEGSTSGGTVPGFNKISGRISSDRGLPVTNGHIIAYDKRLGGEVAIGEGYTDPFGNYKIVYPKDKLEGKTSPDIQLGIFEADNNQKEIIRSEIKYNASEEETIDVVIAASKVLRPVEFERLLNDIRPILGDKTLKELKEDETHSDITLIANKTGWDARIIAMASQADQLSSETKIPAEHYYAIFRSGVAGNSEAVSKLSSESLGNLLNKAVEYKVIQSGTNIQETIKIQESLSADYILHQPPVSGVSSLNSLLELRLNNDQKKSFVESYRQSGEDVNKFWQSLKEKGFDEHTVSSLQTDGKLGYLTLQNAPLMKRLYGNFRISDPAELVQAGLYKEEEWERIIGQDLPTDISLKDYAKGMANMVQKSYPSLVVSEMIQRNEVSTGTNVLKEELSDFFKKTSDKYTIGQQPVKSWDGFHDLKPEMQSAVKKIERLYQLTPSNDAMKALSFMNFDSAFHVMNFTRNEFKKSVSEAFKNEEEIDMVYTKANEIYSSVLNLATTYLTYRGMPNVYGISGKLKKEQQEIIAYPTLEELFGNMDYCACDHCKSVLSPAAYLVELLQFTDVKYPEKQNPIEVLNDRRPDIQHLQLTCENTNTVLPYIDLVNEILEYYIANKGSLSNFKGHDVTEGVKTDDLLADPQFVIDSVYSTIKEKVFPYNLPFDQPLEALRLIFKIWDLTLEEGLEIFEGKEQTRIERLGLTKEEYQIFTNITYKNLPEYFGEPEGNSIDDLNTAISGGKNFCHRVEISYEDLIDILKTKFINPGSLLVPALSRLKIGMDEIVKVINGSISDDEFKGNLPKDLNLPDYDSDVPQWIRKNQDLILKLIVLKDINPDEPCDCNFAEVQLRYLNPDVNADKLTALEYHKLHRFIRLMKKEGWSITQTDSLINTFLPLPPKDLNEGNLDGAFVKLLARIANFLRVMDLQSISDKKQKDWLILWDKTISRDVRIEQLAKLLKFTVPDLNDLSTLSNIDPLADDFDTDKPSLIKLLKIVALLKDLSVKVKDLDYILWSKDISGKLESSESEILNNLKVISQVLNTVDAENGSAPVNADFSFAKDRMSQVYDPTIVNDFFAFLTDSKTYSTPLILKEESLPDKLIKADLKLNYDAFSKLLTYNGVLTDEAQNNLKSKADLLVDADLSNITSPADLDNFKNDFKDAVTSLFNLSKDDLKSFGDSYPELKSVFDIVKPIGDPAKQTQALLDEILPDLKLRLKVFGLKNTLSAILKSDIEITGILTERPEVVQAMSDNSKSVVNDFINLQKKVLFNNNQIYEFYVDPIATDDYLLYIQAPENTLITFTFDGIKVLDNISVGMSKEAVITVPVPLKTGVIYAASLQINNLPTGGEVNLLWRTKAMAKSIVPANNIFDKGSILNAKASLIRLQKAVYLHNILKLTPMELSWLTGNNEETKNILNDLDTGHNISDPALHELWDKVLLLLEFVKIKNDYDSEEDNWINILKDPEVKNGQGKNLLLSINYWNETDLDKVLEKFSWNKNNLTSISNLKKVLNAMAFVTTTGYPTLQVLNWITNSPDAETIRDIKAQIKAKIDGTVWLETMQSISDPLRNRQRDALVSFILTYYKPSEEVNTANKLFEYFLIDVEMDACMQTSRIRQALSSVQLFINRCLINLEPKVAPSSIKAEQWEWMRRYRIWEANRKVFLYPENWLEPELRDNKSSFYKELEGELFQSDLNQDLAEKAYLTYLKKLDEVARLEIVGMYLEENEKGNQNDDIVHVFGRTNGQHREHYYRRFEYGYWTPWEKISVTIDGDYIYPVMWKNRLFIFWLKSSQKAQGAQSGGANFSMENLSTGDWKDNVKIRVELTMHWLEYYDGKWSSPKSSDLDKPIVLSYLSSFDIKNIILYGRIEPATGNTSERLIFSLYYYGDINYIYKITYTSKNSPPIITQEEDSKLKSAGEFNAALFRKPYESSGAQSNAGIFIDTNSSEFKVNVDQPNNKASITELLLTRKSGSIGSFQLFPMRYKVTGNQWEAPFFYRDERSIFYGQPDEELVPIKDFTGYYDFGILTVPPIKEIPQLAEKPKFKDPKGPVVNPWDGLAITSNPNYTVILPSTDIFSLGKVNFGVDGKLQNSLQSSVEIFN